MERFLAALRLPSVRLSLAGVALLGLAMCAIPLLQVHGVESALLLGIVVPVLAAACAARVTLSLRDGAARPMAMATTSVQVGLSLLAVPALLLALNTLRVGACDPLEGLVFMALGPGAGVLLASLWGCFAAALPMGPRLATLISLLPPLGSIALGLDRLYATPGVFAYGHFFGYYPGTLYDELVRVPRPLLTLRLATLTLCLGLLAGLQAHFNARRQRLLPTPRPGHRTLSATLLCALLIGVVVEIEGDALGHRSSVAHIEEALGGRHESARCDIVHPREMSRRRLTMLAEHCDVRVRQIEDFLGLSQPRPVRVFMFRSANEKRALMGAGGTNIAKPWRGEVYLQVRDWPHPVLAHELAHVVAAHTGVGPLRVSGRLGGLWPDPSLIEGLAVAAAWADSSRHGMTPHQWVRAMIALDMAPALSDVVGAGFFGQQKRMAYTVAGSFLRWVWEVHGRAALRAVYRSGDAPAALGAPLPELERRWRQYLQRVELPDSALALAELRFSGSSILSSVCPHEKAALRAELGAHLGAGDDAQAVATCRELLEIDPAETGVRATLVAVLARQGQQQAAREQLAALVGPPSAAPPTIDAARQALADEAWRAGRLQEAEQAYQALLESPNGRDARRQLQLKLVALRGGARQRKILAALLLPEPGERVDGATAVHLMRELRAVRGDGLPHYLEARQLYFRSRYAEAEPLLARARELGLPTQDMRIEALRVQAICAAGAGHDERSARLWRVMRGEAPDLALRAEADDWLQRLRIARTLHPSAKGAS